MLTHSRTVPRLVIEEKIWKTKENSSLDRPISHSSWAPGTAAGRVGRGSSKSIFIENPPKISSAK